MVNQNYVYNFETNVQSSISSTKHKQNWRRKVKLLKKKIQTKEEKVIPVGLLEDNRGEIPNWKSHRNFQRSLWSLEERFEEISERTHDGISQRTHG